MTSPPGAARVARPWFVAASIASVLVAALDALVALALRALLSDGLVDQSAVLMLTGALLCRGAANLGASTAIQLGREAYASALRRGTLAWLVERSSESDREQDLAHDLVDVHPQALVHVQMQASTVSLGIQALLLAAAALYLAPNVAPPALAALAASGGVVALLGRTLTARASRAVNAHRAFLADVQRTVTTLPVVRALRLETGELARGYGRIAEHARDARRLASYSAMLGALPTLIGAPVLALVLAASLAAGLAPASVVAFVLILVRMVVVGSGLASAWATVRATSEAHRRAGARVDAALDVAPDEARAFGAAPRVVFDRVTLRVGDRTLISALDLDVAPGEHLFLVGATGVGKTTLLEVLLGVRPANGGGVRIDGHTPDAYLHRHRVGYLGPHPCLFAGTLRENLALEAGAVDDAALEDAMHAASAREILERVGLDGMLGENGAPLSSGERQRVGLARALVGRPGLLVLDEPTAHVDAATQAELLASVGRLRGRATCIAATHEHRPVEGDRVHALGVRDERSDAG